jgi:Transposase
VAIEADEQPIARVQLVADRCQVQRLLAWAEPLGTQRTWAVESAEGLGKLFAQQLLEAGEQVIDVPATLAARVRLGGSTKAAKNDPNDALATAIAGLRHCGRRAVRVEDDTAVIRMVIDRYDDLVALRTQAVCRLHVGLRELIAGGAPRRLGADRAAKLLRSVRPQGPAGLERSVSPWSCWPTSVASTATLPPPSAASATPSWPRAHRYLSCTVSARSSRGQELLIAIDRPEVQRHDNDHDDVEVRTRAPLRQPVDATASGPVTPSHQYDPANHA